MKKDLESKKSPPNYYFLLYIAGNEPNSQNALQILKKVGEKYLQGKYILEVVDVFKDYEAALKNNIFFAPTLVIKSPPPETKVVGSLNNIKRFLEIFRLPVAEEDL